MGLKPARPASAPLAPSQPTEQLRYARWLEWGSRLGQCVLAVSFTLYLLGLMQPLIPPESLPQYWTLPVKDFLRATESPSGWLWLSLLDRSDMAGLLGISILAGSSLLAVLALLPLYWRRKDYAFVLLCAGQMAVLLLAASGVLMPTH